MTLVLIHVRGQVRYIRLSQISDLNFCSEYASIRMSNCDTFKIAHIEARNILNMIQNSNGMLISSRVGLFDSREDKFV